MDPCDRQELPELILEAVVLLGAVRDPIVERIGSEYHRALCAIHLREVEAQA